MLTIQTQSPNLIHRYEATWESLGAYQAPDWFRDAKFGIWSHWGPQAVPMQGDWYARHMYEEGSPVYKAHLAEYGHPSEHGFVEILEKWKAEKWDPDRLMRLYKAAGAKYFVSMGVHHDNFDLWNSKFHRWNAVEHGPHKDVVGLWEKAARKYGLKFGVSEHLGASYTWWRGSKSADKTGPKTGVPYDGNDPNLQDLYHPLPAANDTDWYTKNEAWHSEWYLRVNDLVSNYQPDLLYSDGGLPFDRYGLQTVANLYNQNHEAVYLAKGKETSAYVEDRERGSAKDIVPNPWQTDTSIGDWFYNKNWAYRKADWVIKNLVDTCSKNGNLLLNIVQKPDGSLDDEVETLLVDLAEWMKVNGESIFGTRPWITFGEGPTRISSGSFKEDFPYTTRDVRFVTKGKETLYATLLGEVSDEDVTITSLRKSAKATAIIKTVHLLGVETPLTFKQDNNEVKVHIPKSSSRFVTVLKFSCTDVNNFDPPPYVAPPLKVFHFTGDTVVLDPLEARLDGSVSCETREGQSNFGYWFDERSMVVWRLDVKQPSRVKITSEWSCLDPSHLEVVFKGKTQHFELVKELTPTHDWGSFSPLEFGTLDLPTDSYEVMVRPVPGKWSPINLRGLRLVPAK
ncbi:MAG: alpha-L-fucosidase [Armatimonadetes bacterium]|nr:alpha-L-fucosidase [Armatimonadota bacterium]